MLNCTGATVKDIANELLLKIASFFEEDETQRHEALRSLCHASRAFTRTAQELLFHTCDPIIPVLYTSPV